MAESDNSKSGESFEDTPVEGNIQIPEVVEKSLKMSVSLSSGGIKDWINRRREGIRSWSEFLNSSRFKKPSSVASASTRVVKNIEHFQSNYIFVFIGLLLYCLLTSPLLLIALAALFGAFYFVSIKNAGQKLKVAGYELTLFQQYLAIGGCSLPIFFLIGAGSAFFWVIGASFVAIMLHAVMYDPSDALDDETEIMMEEVVLGNQ